MIALLARLLALYLGVTPLYAQTVGANASQLLSRGPGAESAALAGTSVSTVHDPTALYWNPAGLASAGGMISGEHLFLFGGARYDFVGLTVPSRFGTFSGGALQLERSNIVARTAIDDPGTDVSNTQSVYLLGYARPLSEHWTAGVTADMLDFNIAGYSNRGFGLDAGMQGRYEGDDFLGLKRVVWSLGAMVKNLVEPKLTLSQDAENYPREYRAGAALSFETASRPQSSGVIEHDRATIQVSARQVTGAPGLNPAIGLAYDYLGVMVFRLGYDGGVSGGMGLRTPDQRFALDYSLENQPFALDHRFTISYRFGAPAEKKPAAVFREVIDSEYERAKAQAEALAQENAATGETLFRDQKYQQAAEAFRLASLLTPDDKRSAGAYKRAQEAFRVQEIHRLSTDATLNPGPGQEPKAYLAIAELLGLGVENKDGLTGVLQRIVPRIPAEDYAQLSRQVIDTSTAAVRQLAAAGRYEEARRVVEMLAVVSDKPSAGLVSVLNDALAAKAAGVRKDFDSLSEEQKDHADVRLARAALAMLRAFPEDASAAARARAALARYRADAPLSIKERFYVRKLYYLAAAGYVRHTEASLADAARYLGEIQARDPSDEDADALWSAMTREGLVKQ